MRLVRSLEFEKRIDSLNSECYSIVSVGFSLVQLREVIRILHGFDLGGCSMFHCVLERKVDVGVVSHDVM